MIEGEHAAPEDAQGGMHAPPADAPLGDTLSIREAAELLGKDASTIRRRIQRGQLAAYRRETEHGYEWRIPADGLGAPPPGVHPLHNARLPGIQSMHDAPPIGMHAQEHAPPAAAGNPELIKALDIVDRLQRDNQQLAGQVGYLQAKLQDAQEQIRLLTVDTSQPEPEPATVDEARPLRWWQRVFR